MTDYEYVRFTHDVQDPALPVARDHVRQIFAAPGYVIAGNDTRVTVTSTVTGVSYDVPFSAVREARRVFVDSAVEPTPAKPATKGKKS